MGGEWWVWNSDLCISPDCKIIHKINLIPRPCGMDGNEASVNYVHFKVFGYILSQHTDIICTKNSCTLQVGVECSQTSGYDTRLWYCFTCCNIYTPGVVQNSYKKQHLVGSAPSNQIAVEYYALMSSHSWHSCNSLGIIVTPCNIDLYWVCTCTEWIMWHVPLFAVWRHYTHICGAWQLHRGIPSWVQSTYLQGSPTVYTVRIQIESQLARSCWSKLCWGFTHFHK